MITRGGWKDEFKEEETTKGGMKLKLEEGKKKVRSREGGVGGNKLQWEFSDGVCAAV